MLKCLPIHSNLWQGCTILSGDVIIRHLAEHLRPLYVVFLVSTEINGFLMADIYALSWIQNHTTRLIESHISLSGKDIVVVFFLHSTSSLDMMRKHSPESYLERSYISDFS